MKPKISLQENASPKKYLAAVEIKEYFSTSILDACNVLWKAWNLVTLYTVKNFFTA